MPGLQKGKKHKGGAGRPPLSTSPTVRVTVTLPAPLAARLKELGGGNASLAVRRLLEPPELGCSS
jgi:predicted nucleic acid-binding Zn ribbon protein